MNHRRIYGKRANWSPLEPPPPNLWPVIVKPIVFIGCIVFIVGLVIGLSKILTESSRILISGMLLALGPTIVVEEFFQARTELHDRERFYFQFQELTVIHKELQKPINELQMDAANVGFWACRFSLEKLQPLPQQNRAAAEIIFKDACSRLGCLESVKDFLKRTKNTPIKDPMDAYKAFEAFSEKINASLRLGLRRDWRVPFILSGEAYKTFIQIGPIVIYLRQKAINKITPEEVRITIDYIRSFQNIYSNYKNSLLSKDLIETFEQISNLFVETDKLLSQEFANKQITIEEFHERLETICKKLENSFNLLIGTQGVDLGLFKPGWF